LELVLGKKLSLVFGSNTHQNEYNAVALNYIFKLQLQLLPFLHFPQLAYRNRKTALKAFFLLLVIFTDLQNSKLYPYFVIVLNSSDGLGQHLELIFFEPYDLGPEELLVSKATPLKDRHSHNLGICMHFNNSTEGANSIDCMLRLPAS
jgi:hypothetical protein